MKKLLLAAALSACLIPNLAGAANEGEGCGTFSQAVQDEINGQSQVLADLRSAAAKIDRSAGDRLGAPRVDVKAISCVDKYSKMKIIVSFPWPNLDTLFDKLYTMACSYVDGKVNEMTSQLGMNQNLPYGLGNLGIGVGQGTSGSGSSSSPYYETREKNQDVTGRVLGGLFH
jgi:hypothetical protein